MHALLNVALPVFGIILAGYGVGRLRLLGPQGSQVLNGFAFYVALPALLIAAMSRIPMADVLNGPFIAAYVGGTALTFVLAWGFGGALFRDNPPAERTMMGMTAVFANSGYMGVPLFLAAFGPTRAVPAFIAMVLMATVILSAGIVLVELSHARSGSATSRRELVIRLSRAVTTNPLVVSPALGLAVSASGLALPRPIATFLDLMGAAAGPCALFALGLFLVGKPLRANLAEVAWVTAIKLLVQPAVTWVIAVPLLGLEPFLAGSVVLLSATPTAALVFTLAQRYDVYVDRASSATLVSTVLSVLTVPIILVLFDLR